MVDKWIISNKAVFVLSGRTFIVNEQTYHTTGYDRKTNTLHYKNEKGEHFQGDHDKIISRIMQQNRIENLKAVNGLR